MQKQCAGCGKVFDDGSGKEDVTPLPYGCCETCNGHTFRSHAKPETIEVEQSVVDNVMQDFRDGLDKALVEKPGTIQLDGIDKLTSVVKESTQMGRGVGSQWEPQPDGSLKCIHVGTYPDDWDGPRDKVGDVKSLDAI